MSNVAILGGSVLLAGGQQRCDVLIEDDIIAAVGSDLFVPKGAQVLDAEGCVVGPGFVDLHTHLREPGSEEAESIETGARAAAVGGYTTIVAMPNTTPAIDCASVAKDVLALGRTAPCRVLVAGAITKDRKGCVLAPMAELAHLGVRMFTDDGCGVQDGDLMRRALEYAGTLRAQNMMVFLAQHCEETTLAADGVMHDGLWAAKLGLPGVPSLAEEVMVFRDLVLAEMTGVPVHFLHLSTKGSVELVRRGKARGICVSAEAAPHHFTLTDACIQSFDPVFKVNPPLRERSDVDAVREGLCDGTIDAVATDHAPHAPEQKDLPFDQAPPGMLGLETAFCLGVRELGMSIEDVWSLYSRNPAQIIGEVPGVVAPGGRGDLCVFDEAAKWTLDPMDLASKSHNSPYRDHEFVGKVRHTLCRGEPVVIDAQPQK